MEQRLLSNFKHTLKNQTKPSLKPFSIARSLIVSPSTSDQAIVSILQTLEALSTTAAIANSQFYLLHVTTLLYEISTLRRHFSSLVTSTLHSLSSLNIPPRAAGLSLSTIVSIAPSSSNEITEGLFLSLCFSSCVTVRQRLLQNVEKFGVPPSILLTMLLGFTKDPFPYVRRAALDGLCKFTDVDDYGMIEGCYLRGVELLFDSDEYVRCSAVNMVSEWGKFLVTNSEDEKSKRDWSDALYVQICSMARDMSVKVRIEAFTALGKLGGIMVSDYILMQTLSKKVLPITKEKEKKSPPFCKLSASSFAGAFVHGLEDEFHEVRSCACYSLRKPAILCADFAGVLGLLMDVLNDDSAIVRLEALETMHHMAVYGHLKVLETHMHMFLGTLVDLNSSIRLKARKILRLINLSDHLPKLVFESLLQSLQIYPQDEIDVLSLIFDFGRNHASFAVSFTKEIFSEMQESSNWELTSSKMAAHIVLAISAPLSRGKQHRSQDIPPIMFSYAVTMLKRISRALTHVMNQDTLLTYLSHCSSSSSTEEEGKMVKNDDVHITSSSVRLDLESINQLQVREDDIADNYVKLVFANITQVWNLTKFGYKSEVLTALRSWKQELSTFITTNPRESDSIITFTLQYLQVVKLLSKAWWLDEPEYILQKLDTKLKYLKHRFIGLSKPQELHIHELILLTCALRFDLKKLHTTMSRVTFLYKEDELSRFMIELTKILKKEELLYTIDIRESFVLNPFVFHGEKLRHIKAEVDVFRDKDKNKNKGNANDWLNPIPFVVGLPVGIPLKIKLCNTPMESKLWVMMGYEDLKEYVFVDLKRFEEGEEKTREFTIIAPLYRTPKVKSFVLRVCIGMEMECSSKKESEIRCFRGPKHELLNLCKEKQVFLSMVGKTS